MVHPVQWNTASPLWEKALQDATPDRFRRPALLRFDNDDFMEQLQGMLAADPSRLAGVVARAETGLNPAVGWRAADDALNGESFRLYQPAQRRYYLVAASLNCRVPGLPDRRVDSAADERVSFLLRRLGPRTPGGTVKPTDASTYTEYAWIAQGQKKGWSPVTDGAPDAGEERLPLFPLQFQLQGVQRRVWAGFVPVASRETYEASALSPLRVPQADLAGDPLADPRLAEFQASVAEALTALRDQIVDNPAKVTDAEARGVFLFALLDLADFLRRRLPDAWKAITADGWSGPSNSSKVVFDHLASRAFSDGVRWDDALRKVWRRRDAIRNGRPGTFVTDPLSPTAIKNLVAALKVADTEFANPNSFNSRIRTALGAYKAPAQAAQPVEAPKIDPDAGDFYRIYCLYERPRCRGYRPPLLSRPTRPFQLAGFFHPDAPARPLRIALPVDTSVAGLRKFPRNVAVLVSNQLRQQMERVDGVKLSDLDDGAVPPEKPLNLGMVCSLSIPIITICAMILLMIIVQLLNIVFWWLPFFKICLPLNLKAK